MTAARFRNSTLAVALALGLAAGCTAPEPLTERTLLVEHLVFYPNLPAGLVVERSWGIVDLGLDGGPMAGAFIRSADGSAWYGADWSGSLDDPNPEASAAFWGPFASEAACRPHMLAQVVAMIDAEGTDGASDWLTLP
jgi:hypothetical protein